MQQAIGAYHRITATEEFKELERLRSRARHNEASALKNARQEGKAEGIAEGETRAREKWQGVVAEKDAEIARLRAMLDENKQ
ncbi:MAG: hypothetical protein LBH86_09255 [Oscillospiraceae bacterium]|nr:hypothetical protein [Oscillospiraceae bacterium]